MIVPIWNSQHPCKSRRAARTELKQSQEVMDIQALTCRFFFFFCSSFLLSESAIWKPALKRSGGAVSFRHSKSSSTLNQDVTLARLSARSGTTDLTAAGRNGAAERKIFSRNAFSHFFQSGPAYAMRVAGRSTLYMLPLISGILCLEPYVHLITLSALDI